MKYRILTALCIAALAIGCNKNEADSDENIGLFDEAVSVEMPYLGFYDTDTKSGVIDFEAEKANYDMDNSSSNTMVFASIECTDFPTREYVFESGRQLKSVRMVGASERTVWNSNLIDVLAGMGYTRTSADKDMVTLDNAKAAVRAQIMRRTSDGVSYVLFTPTDELPELPELESKLIHPFHTFGATAQQIAAGEAAEGRTLYNAGEKGLYVSLPAEQGTIFDRFGFWVDETTGTGLYKVMSIVTDGTYLDSDEFVDAMRQDGYVFNKQENGYKFFTSSDGKCVVRSANLAPYPTIEYLEPGSLEL